MTDDDLLQTISQAVSEECENVVSLTPDMTAADVDGWDSLAHVRIMMRIEARLNISLDMDKTYQAKDIGDLIALVQSTPEGLVSQRS